MQLVSRAPRPVLSRPAFAPARNASQRDADSITDALTLPPPLLCRSSPRGHLRILRVRLSRITARHLPGREPLGCRQRSTLASAMAAGRARLLR
jgi:hypothetical protein